MAQQQQQQQHQQQQQQQQQLPALPPPHSSQATNPSNSINTLASPHAFLPQPFTAAASPNQIHPAFLRIAQMQQVLQFVPGAGGVGAGALNQVQTHQTGQPTVQMSSQLASQSLLNPAAAAAAAAVASPHSTALQQQHQQQQQQQPQRRTDPWAAAGQPHPAALAAAAAAAAAGFPFV